jgi:hypothetical protein
MIRLDYAIVIYLLIIYIKDITNIYFISSLFWNRAGVVVCFSNNFVFPLVLFIKHRSIVIYRCLFLVLSIRLIMIIIWYFNWFSKDVYENTPTLSNNSDHPLYVLVPLYVTDILIFDFEFIFRTTTLIIKKFPYARCNICVCISSHVVSNNVMLSPKKKADQGRCNNVL